jgi:NAD(P)-dependent dehydrogenase (short-subunit alcohol dehydrogenase family)
MTDDRRWRRWSGLLDVVPPPDLPPLPMATLPPGPPALAGRVVLVTGGSSGLGRSLVDLFLGEGALVSTLSRRPAPGVRAEWQERFVAVQGDLARPGDGAGWLRGILASAGKIDVLVNNAALVDGDVVDGAAADLGRILAVDVIAPHELITLAAEGMRDRRHGRILNITSDLSRRPAPGHLAYAAAKAALNSLTMSWAARLRGTGVLVNALHPGHLRTRMNPAGQLLPEVTWPMVLALCSCGSDGPTGRFFTPQGEARWP